jgi:hypothetical protein
MLLRASPVLALASATVLMAALFEPASAKPPFAPAQTTAEQTLARLLKADAANPDAVDPIGGRAGRRPRTTPPPGAPYLRYLTTPVATAMLVEEAQEVKTNCGGVYEAGEECGTGSDPVSCGQDFPDSTCSEPCRADPAWRWSRRPGRRTLRAASPAPAPPTG